MKILVTGGAGFIGSHVTEAYLSAGHRVTVLDNLSHGKKTNVPAGAAFVKADVRSPRISEIFKKGRFEVVCHHAAQMDVRYSVEHPREDADINILGLLNLLEAAKNTGVKKIIFAASGGTYYGECPRPARESNPPHPLSPYGVSKLVSEHYLQSYKALFGLDFTVLRYANVYGPRQDPHGEAGVVAIFCGKILDGEGLTVFGTGRQERDYVFVKDVARANLLALSRGGGRSFNIGTGKATSVLSLAKTLMQASDKTVRLVHKPARPGELNRSVLNIAEAKKSLSWFPGTPLLEGLRATYQFIQGTKK